MYSCCPDPNSFSNWIKKLCEWSNYRRIYCLCLCWRCACMNTKYVYAVVLLSDSIPSVSGYYKVKQTGIRCYILNVYEAGVENCRHFLCGNIESTPPLCLLTLRYHAVPFCTAANTPSSCCVRMCSFLHSGAQWHRAQRFQRPTVHGEPSKSSTLYTLVSGKCFSLWWTQLLASAFYSSINSPECCWMVMRHRTVGENFSVFLVSCAATETQDLSPVIQPKKG